MISYGQKTLNRKDVRKGTLHFILSFLALTAVSFLSVFLFFKSSDMQNRNMRKELDAYHNVIGRNEVLKIKMDSIYYKLTLLNSDKISNQIELRNQIFKDLGDCKNFIGEDSLVELKHYSRLVKDIDPIIAYKNELMKLGSQEKAIFGQLQDCLGKVGRANVQIKVKQQREAPKGSLFNR